MGVLCCVVLLWGVGLGLLDLCLCESEVAMCDRMQMYNIYIGMVEGMVCSIKLVLDTMSAFTSRKQRIRKGICLEIADCKT
jgi:hypothetical protein